MASTTVPPLDLTYELQVEYNWDAAFALAAKDEYIHWLKLRVDNNDLEFCKLPPSRVVAMVWSVHMLWTRDYAKVCANLGGFVHSYPPAMRMTVTREQAYTATLTQYKVSYGHDAPATYWGPSICESEANSTPGNPRRTPGVPTKVAGSASGTPHDKIDATPTTPRPRGRPRKTPLRSPMQTSPEAATPGRSTRTSAAAATPTGAPTATGAAPPTSPNRGGRRRSMPSMRPSGITKPGGVLRPLAPGEKRGRGRPKQSDYVQLPVTAVEGAAPVTTTPASAAGGASEPGGLVESASAPQTLTGTPRGRGRPRKNPVTPSGPVAAGAAAATTATGTPVAAGAAADSTPTAAKMSPATPATGDGVHKRPRGRPRKDGSWPRPRVSKDGAMAAAVRAAIGSEATEAAKAASKSGAVAAAKAAGTVAAKVTEAGEKAATADKAAVPTPAPATGAVAGAKKTDGKDGAAAAATATTTGAVASVPTPAAVTAIATGATTGAVTGAVSSAATSAATGGKAVAKTGAATAAAPIAAVAGAKIGAKTGSAAPMSGVVPAKTGTVVPKPETVPVTAAVSTSSAAGTTTLPAVGPVAKAAITIPMAKAASSGITSTPASKDAAAVAGAADKTAAAAKAGEAKKSGVATGEAGGEGSTAAKPVPMETDTPSSTGAAPSVVPAAKLTV